MKRFSTAIAFILLCFGNNSNAQNITYSTIEKGNAKNTTFEIIGKVSNSYLVYKNLFNTHKISVYNNDMTLKEDVKLDYISDKTTNIDFIPYPDKAILTWQYQKKNMLYCMAAIVNPEGKIIGSTHPLETTKITTFSNNTYQNIRWSDDKKRILFYKYTTKGDDYILVTKIYNENLLLLDSNRLTINFEKYKESFSDLQIDNNGNIVFSKSYERNNEDFISKVEIQLKKIKNDTLFTFEIPLDDQIIKEPNLKIDNYNNSIILNAFSYKKYGGVIVGMFTALVNTTALTLKNKSTNLFSDTLLTLLSGKPDWKTAYENYFFKNIVLKKDGGFLIIAEEYYKERRVNNGFNDRNLNSIYNNSFGFNSDYYSYNRGNYGYYRPLNDNSYRDVVFHYDDVIVFSFNKDLQLQWNSVINKTGSDVDTDNYLSFTNMNVGSEIHFLFFQKDNKQILSNHSIQPSGNITRYPTLKTRETGYEFMPKLGRQIGAKQMLIPCYIRNGIAFAKIDF